MKRYHFYSIILFFLLVTSSLFAKDNTPSIEGLFSINVEAEILNDEDIIKSALLFSLCEEGSERWNTSIAKYRGIKDYCDQKDLKNLGVLNRAEKLNEYMYEACLDKYKSLQTRVDEMLLAGTYNCVSSSILYLALAKYYGIDARVQRTPQHAFITIYDSNNKIDVETTNPYGFNPGRTKYIGETSNGSKKYAQIPKTHYSNRKELSQRMAITLIASNLCNDYDKKQKYEIAIPLSIASYNFVNKEKQEARELLDILVMNYVNSLDRKKCSEDALEYLDNVIEKFGMTDFIRNNYSVHAYNSIVLYVNNQDYEAAKVSYEKHKQYVLPDTQNRINNLILQEEYCNKIYNFMISDNYYDALSLCNEAFALLPNNQAIAKVKSNVLQNFCIYIHNSVQPFISNGNYSEVLEILESALEINPNSSLIKKDIKQVQQLLLN